LSTTTSGAEVNVFTFRKNARRRAWICPGAGFALMGRPITGAICYLTSLATFACGIATAISPSRAALTTTIALVVLGTVLWGYEMLSSLTAWPPEQSKVPRFNAWLGALGIAIAIAIFAFVVISSYQLVTFEGGSMYPLISEQETILMHRRVDDAQLKKGTIVFFDLDRESRVGLPGALTMARIIAVPGDTISKTRSNHYVINKVFDERKTAPLDTLVPAIEIPFAPKSYTVPAGGYFVSQEASEDFLDSQLFGLAKRDRIVSTELYRFGKGKFLEKIE